MKNGINELGRNNGDCRDSFEREILSINAQLQSIHEALHEIAKTASVVNEMVICNLF